MGNDIESMKMNSIAGQPRAKNRVLSDSAWWPVGRVGVRGKLVPLLLWACAAGADPDRWEQTATTLALRHGTNILWQFNAGPTDTKPCFHPLALTDGTVLTEFRPGDHPWHRGAWFSWKFIDKVNYWEEDAETGAPRAGSSAVKEVAFDPRPDGSAVIELGLEYAPPAGDTVLTERRHIRVGAPAGGEGYDIVSTHRFVARRDLTLNRNFYGGFAFRCAKKLRGKWTLVDADGRTLSAKPNANGKGFKNPESDAAWVAFVETTNGPTRGVAILNHPDNPKEEMQWCAIPAMPYFNPAPTGKGDIALEVGDELTLRYRIVVFENRPWREYLATRHKELSEL